MLRILCCRAKAACPSLRMIRSVCNPLKKGSDPFGKLRRQGKTLKSAKLFRGSDPFFNGLIGRDPVWYIEADDLGPDLDFRQDRTGHGLLEPNRRMTPAEFQLALAASRTSWKLYCR